MPLKELPQFSYDLGSGEAFRSEDYDFVFAGSTDLAIKGECEAPLQWVHHCSFIQDVASAYGSECFWILESASDAARSQLQEEFPDCSIFGCSMFGSITASKEAFQKFWGIFATLDQAEPWNQEQPWAIIATHKPLPRPSVSSLVCRHPVWNLDHVFRNADALDAVFVQEGWFAYFGLKRNAANSAWKLILAEFPTLATSTNGK